MSSARTSTLRTRSAALVLVASFALGCPRAGGLGGSGQPTSYPPASVYEIDPQFSGQWVGDVNGLRGVLNIGELDDRALFGSFVTDDGGAEYTLLLEHSYVNTEDGGEVPSNRATFTWQDGLGSRGKGWLLINRDDSAVTGSFGFGVATEGLGDWSFVREGF